MSVSYPGVMRLGLICAGLVPLACADAQPSPEGPVGVVQQPIVSGNRVLSEVQQDFGLVTIGVGCSATLLNRFWILTADHCVAQPDATGSVGAKVAGHTVGRLPDRALSNLTITAAWSTRRIVPTGVVRDWRSGGRDIALIFLGAGDFGYDTRLQPLNGDDVTTGTRLIKFGQGLNRYASAGPPATRGLGLGTYRTAAFMVSDTDGITYTLPANGAGQVGNGGDSGGPDVATMLDSIPRGIVGVQSTCVASGYVPGMPQTWAWATGISSCDSAAIAPVRAEIVQIIQEGKRPCADTSAACAILETTSLTLMLH